MSRAQRLSVVLLLNLALVAGLIVVGVTAHSTAVFAEGGDYLLAAAAVGVALLAAGTVAAQINAGWLLAPVHGVFAAQEIRQQARTLATDRGIRCVTLDYDTMRGVIKENTLF